MSIFAQKTELHFESKMAGAIDATEETRTPDVLRPTLGPISNLMYKPARFQCLVRLSAASASGAANLVLYAGETAKKTIALDLSKMEQGVDVGIDLDNIGGAVPWSVGLDVTTAGDAGVTATIDAKMVVDAPAAVI